MTIPAGLKVHGMMSRLWSNCCFLFHHRTRWDSREGGGAVKMHVSGPHLCRLSSSVSGVGQGRCRRPQGASPRGRPSPPNPQGPQDPGEPEPAVSCLPPPAGAHLALPNEGSQLLGPLVHQADVLDGVDQGLCVVCMGAEGEGLRGCAPRATPSPALVSQRGRDRRRARPQMCLLPVPATPRPPTTVIVWP